MHIELRVGDGDAAGVQFALDGLVHGEAHVEVVAACGPQHQKVLDAAVLIVVQHDQRGRILQRLWVLRRGEQGLADLLRRGVIRHADIQVHAAAALDGIVADARRGGVAVRDVDALAVDRGELRIRNAGISSTVPLSLPISTKSPTWNGCVVRSVTLPTTLDSAFCTASEMARETTLRMATSDVTSTPGEPAATSTRMV